MYKVVGEDGRPYHGGSGVWSLPHDGRPGEWMPRIEMIVPCESGYHVCTKDQLVLWLGPRIHEVETRGDVLTLEDKCVAHEARLLRRLDTWTERVARLFACACAERALTRIADPDPRSVEAVRVARLYADGGASQKELAAAGVAAGAAAWVAELAVAGDAARAAAWVAAGAVAGAAARAAAGAAAGDAAGAAAGVAAGAAAQAAAWVAAGAAAWAAARAAERIWQTARLMEYLRGETR